MKKNENSVFLTQNIGKFTLFGIKARGNFIKAIVFTLLFIVFARENLFATISADNRYSHSRDIKINGQSDLSRLPSNSYDYDIWIEHIPQPSTPNNYNSEAERLTEAFGNDQTSGTAYALEMVDKQFKQVLFFQFLSTKSFKDNYNATKFYQWRFILRLKPEKGGDSYDTIQAWTPPLPPPRTPQVGEHIIETLEKEAPEVGTYRVIEKKYGRTRVEFKYTFKYGENRGLLPTFDTVKHCLFSNGTGNYDKIVYVDSVEIPYGWKFTADIYTRDPRYLQETWDAYFRLELYSDDNPLISGHLSAEEFEYLRSYSDPNSVYYVRYYMHVDTNKTQWPVLIVKSKDLITKTFDHKISDLYEFDFPEPQKFYVSNTPSNPSEFYFNLMIPVKNNSGSDSFQDINKSTEGNLYIYKNTCSATLKKLQAGHFDGDIQTPGDYLSISLNVKKAGKVCLKPYNIKTVECNVEPINFIFGKRSVDKNTKTVTVNVKLTNSGEHYSCGKSYVKLVQNTCGAQVKSYEFGNNTIKLKFSVTKAGDFSFSLPNLAGAANKSPVYTITKADLK